MVNTDYLYNPDAAKRFFNKNYFSDKKLGFSVIKNGIILPHKKIVTVRNSSKSFWGLGGIIDKEGNYIHNSFVREGLGDSYVPSPESVQYSSETVIYLGMFYPVWGHVITDNIRRMWFLKSDEFKHQFKNCPLVYLNWSDSLLENQTNFRRLLEILGVDVDKFRSIKQPTRFENIILPEESFSWTFTEEYRETIEQLKNFALKNRMPIESKKLYYFYGKYQIGEERMAEYFKSKGYAIVHPEKLTIDEQLNLLINCESFASTLGSLSHNSVFLRDGTETILIPRLSGYFAFCQPRIDQVCSLNATYIDSTLSIFASGTPRANVFLLSKQLKQFFGDKFNGYEEEDFKLFLDYVKSSINKGLTFNFWQKISYGTIFQDFLRQLKRREDLMTACDMPPGWEKMHPLLTYQTHIDKEGWSAWNNEEQISNPIEELRDIQAIKINFPNHKIYYSVYFNDTEGWSAEVLAPETAGTVGESKSITGMKIRLDEAGAKEFDILYRAHTFGGTWTPWAKNGEELLSGEVKLNAIQIKLRPLLNYQTHLHNKGWGDGWHTENQISNPLDQKLDILAVRLNFTGVFHKVYYSVYFNDEEGWSKEVLAPEMAGTVGVRKPIYGIRIRFDEAGAKEFDILYRMHKFDDTWTPWAKNGEALYSHGVKLNAIQVKLESKSETEKT